MTKLTKTIIQELRDYLDNKDFAWEHHDSIEMFLNEVEKLEHQEQEQEECSHPDGYRYIERDGSQLCAKCTGMAKPPTQEPKRLDKDDFVILYNHDNQKWMYGFTHVGMLKLLYQLNQLSGKPDSSRKEPMISSIIKTCCHCQKEYHARKNSLYCLECAEIGPRKAKREYQKRYHLKKRMHDPSDPVERSLVARKGGIARAAKYMEGMSSIAYEPPPVVCPECGSFRTVQAFGTRYDCLEAV